MATITGLTAEAMQAIVDDTIVGAHITGDNLILEKHDGTTVDAGDVRGPVGPDGPVYVPTLTKHVVGAGGEPAFTNGWANQGGGSPSEALTFWKDLSGSFVTIAGMINGNAKSGNAVFTLPAGFRPPGQIIRRFKSQNAAYNLLTDIEVNIIPATGVVSILLAVDESSPSAGNLHYLSVELAFLL